jgi:hypothetical protein
MTKNDYAKCACRHCGGHIEYPTEAGGQTIACPHCGKEMELPEAAAAAGKSRGLLGWATNILWVAIVAAAIAVILSKRAASVSAPDKTANQSVVTTPPPQVVKAPEETTTNGFAVSKLKLEKTPGSSLVYVMGTVRNETDKERFGVKAEFSLFDSNGVAAGAASDYAATLAAHETWKFKALVMESKAAKAELAGVREDQ